MIDLPPPSPRIARALQASSSGATIDKLREVLDEDTSLASDLLRAGNSPFFNPGMPAKTPQRLLMMLGMRTVHCIVIGLGVREVFASMPFERSGDFWADTLRRAGVAWRLARLTRRADPLEALFAGLLLDVGALALIERDPSALAVWHHTRGCLPVERPDQEMAGAGSTYNVLSSRMMQAWGLSPAVLESVTMFHSPTSALTELLRMADQLVAVYTARDSQRALQQARLRLQSHWALEAETIDALLRRAPADAQNAATAFGLRIGRQAAWRDLLHQASRAPDTQAMSREQLVEQTERTIRERDNLSFQLQRALEEIERGTSYDPLTGLSNQRHFEEGLLRELPRLGLKSYCMTVLMSDIDELRLVNDRHGHAVGDQVLKGVADSLLRATRASDLQGRLWGGTMVVALPNCTRQDALAVISRIRGRQRELQVDHDDARIRPSVSMSAYTLEGPTTIDETQEGPYLRALLGRLHQGLQRGKQKAHGKVTWVEQEDRWSFSEWWRKL